MHDNEHGHAEVDTEAARPRPSCTSTTTRQQLTTTTSTWAPSRSCVTVFASSRWRSRWLRRVASAKKADVGTLYRSKVQVCPRPSPLPPECAPVPPPPPSPRNASANASAERLRTPRALASRALASRALASRAPRLASPACLGFAHRRARRVWLGLAPAPRRRRCDGEGGRRPVATDGAPRREVGLHRQEVNREWLTSTFEECLRPIPRMLRPLHAAADATSAASAASAALGAGETAGELRACRCGRAACRSPCSTRLRALLSHGRPLPHDS